MFKKGRVDIDRPEELFVLYPVKLLLEPNDKVFPVEEKLELRLGDKLVFDTGLKDPKDAVEEFVEEKFPKPVFKPNAPRLELEKRGDPKLLFPVDHDPAEVPNGDENVENEEVLNGLEERDTLRPDEMEPRGEKFPKPVFIVLKLLLVVFKLPNILVPPLLQELDCSADVFANGLFE